MSAAPGMRLLAGSAQVGTSKGAGIAGLAAQGQQNLHLCSLPLLGHCAAAPRCAPADLQACPLSPAEPARKFDHWLSRAAQPWPAPSGGGMQQVNMTAGRSYSAIPGLKDCPPGTNAAGGGGAAAGQRRLQRQQGKRWRPEDFEL